MFDSSRSSCINIYVEMREKSPVYNGGPLTMDMFRELVLKVPVKKEK